MKLGNDSVKNKFDDISNKVDGLIALCQALRSENQGLLSRIKELETDLEKKNQAAEMFSEQEALIQSRIDVLLTKLDSFTRSEET
jgi:prefoldin subunit 5